MMHRSLPFILLLATGAACSKEPDHPPADLVLRGAAVYTLDPKRPWAEAVAIRQGRITYVGTLSGVESHIGGNTRVADLHGRMLMPGFHDSHTHPVLGGVETLRCAVHELESLPEVKAAIAAYARKHPKLAWIVGGGWELPLFPQANPHRKALDALILDRPAYLAAADGHSAWVNTAALKIAGVDAKTPDPPDGRIERDPDGTPSGTLRESAMLLVGDHVPKTSLQESIRGLQYGLALAHAAGITSVVEAAADEDILKAYAALDAAGGLSARVIASVQIDAKRGIEQIPDLVAQRARYQTKNLSTVSAKLFADGVIEAKTAALLQPYVAGKNAAAGGKGKLNLDPERLKALITALDAEKFQIHVHAIGDRAVRETLDAFESAQVKNGPRDARHHIAHLQLIDAQDMPRFKQLGVIANVQPLWAYADTYIRDLTAPVLGPERSRWLYPIGSLIRSEAKVVAGSDWPVSSMNPLEGIQVALTRKALDDDATAPAWLPEQRVELSDILAAYTINGAYLIGREHQTGSIEVGKSADLAVLSRNLFEVSAHEIHGVRVEWTLREGKTVFKTW